MSERMLELMEGIMVCWGQELVLQRQSTGARSKSFSASIRWSEATGRNSLNSVSMVVGLCEDKSSRWRPWPPAVSEAGAWRHCSSTGRNTASLWMGTSMRVMVMDLSG